MPSGPLTRMYTRMGPLGAMEFSIRERQVRSFLIRLLLVGGVDADDVDAAALDLGALLHELGVLVGGLAQLLVALG